MQSITLINSHVFEVVHSDPAMNDQEINDYFAEITTLAQKCVDAVDGYDIFEYHYNDGNLDEYYKEIYVIARKYANDDTISVDEDVEDMADIIKFGRC